MKLCDSKLIFSGLSGTRTNTVSFSCLTRLRNGQLLSTARLGSGKDTADGNIGIWRSDDNGQKWSDVLMPLTTSFEGKNGCLRTGCVTELSNGRLLMSCAWVDRSVEGRALYNNKTGGLCEMFPVISYSDDGGCTWSPLQRVDLFPVALPSALTGPTLVLSDGGIACQFESQKTWDSAEPIYNISAFKVSYDEGDTWPEYVQIAGRLGGDTVCWDQRIAQFPSGKMINLFWSYNTVTNTDQTIHMSVSNEWSRNWSKPIDTGIVGQIACPVVMSELHVIMLYVRRDKKRQILARQSFDGGKTWDVSSEVIIYNQAQDYDDSSNLFDAMNQWSYGHPFGIKLSDHEIAMVYYAGKGSYTSLNFCKIYFKA
ncbi:MAG: hypothetical protein A2Y07_10585 [Planctomycetes bacterium GWF2_50_10]|nr:MAG: hypothetical protein A2Y07_10585 [Planctomycetes bacterium GWF2_50_10]